jgi:hypothetical protein
VVGASFVEPSERKLRIMAIGINSYVDAQHAAMTTGAWFAEWFTTGKYRYQRAVRKSLSTLAAGLVDGPHGLGNLHHAGLETVYLTNAIKTYLPTAIGKRAVQVTDAQYDAHLPTWKEELRLLAEHDAFPHVIVIVGAPFWGRSCATLALGASFGPATIVERRTFAGKVHHYANLLTVEARERRSKVWHLRIRHPAGRSKAGSAKWLLADEELRGSGATATS